MSSSSQYNRPGWAQAVESDSPEAVAAWLELLGQTHVDEVDYHGWARELAELYERLGRGLSAARIYEYLVEVGPAVRLYEKYGSTRDLGRALQVGRRFKPAADKFRDAGLYAHAGRCAEAADDHAKALWLYEQLIRTQEALGGRYPCGLAALNAGRIASRLGDRERANIHLATATRLLEQEADHREQQGDRDGAFRCYLCLIEIGKQEKSYENIAEGYINCIRILKAKSDRFFTMQYYHNFIRMAEDLGEYHSVADLYREAGEYARRVGFIYSDYFLVEAGQAWMRVAEKGLEAGNPTELVENALLAASGCFNRTRDDDNVARCYEMLGELPLSEAKTERYQLLARDLRDENFRNQTPREGPVLFPEYFRRPIQLPEIWLRDLLEAESGSDIPDAIGRLIGDHQNVWEVQRRKALLIALAYDDHIAAGGDAQRVPKHVIDRLGELGHAAAVQPLLALYDTGEESVRVAVLERGSLLRHKEVFALIDKALNASSARLTESGLNALRRMTFPQALDSLVRIFGGHASDRVKEACLKSIAVIGTDEACEFLLDIMRSNVGTSSQRAKQLLEQHAQERMLSALERNRRQEPDPTLRIFIGRLVDQIRAKRGSISF